MKTFALVELNAIRHMVDDRDMAHEIREEANARGVRLVLMRPMETIIDAERFEAIAGVIRAGGGGPGNQDQWSLIMSALDDLKAAVARSTSVQESTIVLLKDLASRTAASSDPDMQALAAEIDAETNKLAAAVAANTPAVQPGNSESIAPENVPPAETPPPV